MILQRQFRRVYVKLMESYVLWTCQSSVWSEPDSWRMFCWGRNQCLQPSEHGSPFWPTYTGNFCNAKHNTIKLTDILESFIKLRFNHLKNNCNESLLYGWYRSHYGPWNQCYNEVSLYYNETLLEGLKSLFNCACVHRGFFFNTIFVSSYMYPENPKGTQVIVHFVSNVSSRVWFTLYYIAIL